MAITSGAVHAQRDTLTAAPGDRIRLWTVSPEARLDGTLLDSGAPGGIWLLSSSDTLRLQRPEVARLEVARSLDKRVGRHALMGAGVGFLAGLVVGIATPQDAIYGGGKSEFTLALAGAGALVGGLVGTVFGVSRDGTAWHPGRLP